MSRVYDDGYNYFLASAMDFSELINSTYFCNIPIVVCFTHYESLEYSRFDFIDYFESNAKLTKEQVGQTSDINVLLLATICKMFEDLANDNSSSCTPVYFAVVDSTSVLQMKLFAFSMLQLVTQENTKQTWNGVKMFIDKKKVVPQYFTKENYTSSFVKLANVSIFTKAL